ncbi:MAG: menaquinone biosynthesis protein [Saprospiraceae bacterium]|nr:menaquinone biosynthesis protein [Saprospiraceae bacterium]
MLKIVLVEYFNSLPFVKSIESTEMKDQFEIIRANPSDCAKIFFSNNADIALLPVGALVENDKFQIITNYCIGCDGPVRTVCLFSNIPFSDVRTISLDIESRTSNLLVKVLNENYWSLHQNIQILPPGSEADARLMIGDKALAAEKEYPYILDLGLEWKKFSGYPFVFAIWACHPNVAETDIQTLNQLFTDFLQTDNMYEKLQIQNLPYQNMQSYFESNISYHFDEQKRMAKELFLRLAVQ